MWIEVHERCNTIEECYRFMLDYAAQDLQGDQGSHRETEVREFLYHAANALDGLAESCKQAIRREGLQPEELYRVFLAQLDHDASNSSAAIELVLAQPRINSQLVANLKASIHLRALLTDLL